MYLKIKNYDLKHSEINVLEKQNDYDLYQKNKIDIFIYGYPFNGSNWVKSEDIYKLYHNHQLNFINALEGVYSIIILDKKINRCYVITDRYGMYSLFYFKNNEIVIISDKIDQILKFLNEIKLNKNKIIEYLAFGHVARIGNETHIEGINEFRRACVYEFKKDLTFTKQIYWKYPVNSENKYFHTNEDYTNDFINAFNSHMSNGLKLENNATITLTGGLDTRVILSSVINKNNNLNCSTYGLKNSYDVEIAKKITNQFGINHIAFIIDEKFIKNIPEKINNGLSNSNGLFPLIQESPWKDFCESNKGNKMLITGILGNTIWNYRYGKINEIKNSLNIDDISTYILNDNVIKKNKTLNVFTNLNEKEIKELFKNSIKKELSYYEGSFNPKAIFEFFILEYYSNWGSNIVKNWGKYFKIFLGLFSKDMLEILTHVDLKTRISRSLQKDIIVKNCLDLAKIPYDHIRHNKCNSIKTLIKRIIYEIKVLFNRITHRFFNFDIFKYYQKASAYFYIWLSKYHKKFILDVLDYDKMIIKNLLKREELQRIVKLFLKGDRSVKTFIISLISLEIYLKNISKNNRIIVE